MEFTGKIAGRMSGKLVETGCVYVDYGDVSTNNYQDNEERRWTRD
jgi:hypothetical protein